MPHLPLLLAILSLGISPIPPEAASAMRGVSWHERCPVPVADLRQLTVQYFDFTGKTQIGTLYTHRDVASELRAIFEELYRRRFPIEQIRPIEQYSGNDDASMAANNTSAFNCRDVTGSPGRFSNHSWGRAVDINPLTNPYVKGDLVLPPAGRAHLDRTKDETGVILADGFVVRLFESKGWTWGGRWKDRQDYQHFEKPVKTR